MHKFDRKKQDKLRTRLLHALAQGGFWFYEKLDVLRISLRPV